jgi:predicted  nucleic acid-binding Zn-ribbon protein
MAEQLSATRRDFQDQSLEWRPQRQKLKNSYLYQIAELKNSFHQEFTTQQAKIQRLSTEYASSNQCTDFWFLELINRNETIQSLSARVDLLARGGETYCCAAVDAQKVLRNQVHELQAANKTLRAANEALQAEQEAYQGATSVLVKLSPKLEAAEEKVKETRQVVMQQMSG